MSNHSNISINQEEKLSPCISIEFLSIEIPLENYKRFSFLINGLLTTVLICFGLIGNGMLLNQLFKQATVRHRMGAHLKMLCLWDICLLLSSLAASAVITLLYKTMRFYGVTAYVVFVANPIGSFSVTGTLWQVVAISMERYLHVVHALWARVYDQRVPVKYISVPIVLLALVLNMPALLFEHTFERCVVDDQQSWEISKSDLAENSEIYKLACHFIPDLLFRCPLPFILVAYFTFRTLHLMRTEAARNDRNRLLGQRQGSCVSQSSRVKIALTALSVKFLCCNSLFTVHTILDILDLKPQNYWDYFLSLLYLTDISNCLLVLNGATNWLLFYSWPSRRQESNRTSLYGPPTSRQRKILVQMWSKCNPEQTGIALVDFMVKQNPTLADLLPAKKPHERESVTVQMQIEKLGRAVGRFLDHIIGLLVQSHNDLRFVRVELHRIGVLHRRQGVALSSEDWKSAKLFLSARLLQDCRDKQRAECEQVAEGFLSLISYEMESGYLCENGPKLNGDSGVSSALSVIRSKLDSVELNSLS